MGSPAFLQTGDSISFGSFDNCWRQMDEIVRGKYDQPLQFVMPVEIGAWNSLAAFAIALLHDNIRVIDGEGAGRAVPTLDLTRLSYASSNPTVIAGDGENYDDATKIGLFIDDVDVVQSLAGAIIPTPGFNNIAGVGLWPLLGKDMKEYIIRNTLTELVIPCGEVMRHAISVESPYRYLVDHTHGAKLIVRGIVTEKNQTTTNALDLLNITVEGVDDQGHDVTTVVYGMNENLFVFQNNRKLPAIVSPDMSCWATIQQPTPNPNASYAQALQPLDNSNIVVNMEVALIGIPSNSITASDEKMMKRWRDTLKPLGYGGEQVSGIFLDE